MRFNATGAQNNDADFGPTAPTSSVVTVGSHEQQNEDGAAMILYAFAPKQGYSKFGTYVGTQNADGPFIYTGFKPAFIMAKKSSASGDWYMFDNKITPTNVVNSYQNANKAEADHDSASYYIDILSNGWKLRGSGSELNNSETFMYWAFAEQPLVANVGSGLPATAR
jgi:hypothetical protein